MSLAGSQGLYSGSLPYWIVTGVIAGARWALRSWSERQAQSWPVVQGTVEWSWVRAEGWREDQPVPEVCYSYSVNGEYYAGTYGTSEANFDLFPKGSPILVHYNPAKHSRSFLDREEIRTRQVARR
jgi:hypothetical protein